MRRLFGALTTVLLLSLTGVQPARATTPVVVHTDTGVVLGFSSDGVDSFLGIPYAAPPVGDLRWRPPQPAAHWTGVRPATQYGNRCPATASSDSNRLTSTTWLPASWRLWGATRWPARLWR